MKKINVKDLTASAQDTIDRQYDSQVRAQRLQGLFKGLGALRISQAKQEQASSMRKNLSSQAQQAYQAAQSVSDPLMKMGLEQQASRLQMMADQTNLTNVDKTFEYLNKPSDPLKLAVDLQKAKLYSSGQESLGRFLTNAIGNGQQKEPKRFNPIEAIGEGFQGLMGGLGAFGRENLFGNNAPPPIEELIPELEDPGEAYDSNFGSIAPGSNPYL